MERLLVTEDGSHSLYSSQFNQQYHSLQGALNESRHIYINLGLQPVLSQSENPVHVFEMGFGTGLNAFLAWKLADSLQKPVIYTTIEAYPVDLAEAALLNYESESGGTGFMQLHESAWGESIRLSAYFTFRKEQIHLQDFKTDEIFDVVFYDAFDPRAQPELWSAEIFTRVAAQTAAGGVLVTYSSKGIVKRALAAAGFKVERHKGPGRKTHVLKAIRI
ncbi:tRNA (5-methylaminomethyl-2-thiouridine)(34)-methyltransferase MnmD [Dyadobacter sp. Leaf189]|uniref:tRNA (5-methylaminomethyl-2-thiouridine)(34)-methyltransferase MnmD n=1 Tax=Dyadobacter sp. Leaf189 TaxID=1736295 RepID=UPI0006FC5F0F|nr:tRNA (5-methylaminomethyl-2-thiouridine)(34)-methyltransferase MnmD [Dyadobacter sp. Leaf189]KQS32606.1 tRNA 5-methylaminomethyl-2-thiouridine biosynthesis bifunctional protein mnmC tRNA mnm(5)s(2)U biosynthesis bifunctional protein [Dyadobacter sp. Leaf189]